jgi:hypothetical protein
MCKYIKEAGWLFWHGIPERVEWEKEVQRDMVTVGMGSQRE